MIICICENCQTLFSFEKMPEKCPNCGELALRPLSEEEVEELKSQVNQTNPDSDDDFDGPMPDICETSIGRVEYYVFRLPVSAFGIRNKTLLEFSVECGAQTGTEEVPINVWVRPVSGVTKQFIHKATIPYTEDMDNRIFEALNNDHLFMERVQRYIEWMLEQQTDI